MLVPDHQTLIIEAHERRARAHVDRQRTLARRERKLAASEREFESARPRHRAPALSGMLAGLQRIVVRLRRTRVASATARRPLSLPFTTTSDPAAGNRSSELSGT